MIIGHLLFLSACGGGGNGNTTEDPRPASLEGERVETDRSLPAPSPFEDEAPTEAHKNLVVLIPTPGLVSSSVKFIGWDGAGAAPTEDAKNAPIPAVSAKFQSAGWSIADEDDGAEGRGRGVQYDYPQQCQLVLIRAPEKGRAAEVIEEKIIERLQSKGFSRIGSLEFSMGFGSDKQIRVPRYARIDDAGDLDNVHIAYVKVIGGLVIYALESEHPRKMEGPDDKKLSIVSEGGLGTRIGAQYLALVYDKLSS